MATDCRETVIQVLYSYPDETIDAVTDYFDEELDYMLEVFDRPLRYSLLAEEMVGILQSDSNSASGVDVIVAIFLRHGINAVRIPPSGPLALMGWGEFYKGYVKLGPILVAMGNGQERKEEEDVLCAAESLCRIRLSALATSIKMNYCNMKCYRYLMYDGA